MGIVEDTAKTAVAECRAWKGHPDYQKELAYVIVRNLVARRGYSAAGAIEIGCEVYSHAIAGAA